MKKTFQLLSIFATLVLLAITAVAQGDSTPENKAAWYKDFLATYKTDQTKAYDDAKKYLACPPNADDADEASRTAYLQKWVTAYEKINVQNEKAKRKAQLSDLVYNKKDYAQAFQVGKQVLADEPDYADGYVALGYAGFAAYTSNPPNKSFTNDSLAYSRKAIELIESGRPVA